MANAMSLPLAGLGLGLLLSAGAYLVFEWPHQRARARLISDRANLLLEFEQARALITQQRAEIAARDLRIESLDRSLAAASADAARDRSLAEASRAALAEIGEQKDSLAAAKAAALAAQVLGLSADGLSQRKIQKQIFGYVGGKAYDQVSTILANNTEEQQRGTGLAVPVTQEIV